MRQRIVLVTALVALTAMAWVQMLMPDEVAPGVDRLRPCCGVHFGVTFAMWVVMMAAMMIPSVAPMVLTHAALVRRRERRAPYLSSALFLTGYLVTWSVFSAGAAAAQWLLFRANLLDAHSLAIGPLAGAGALLAAGLFQVSRAKQACLAQCRAPLGYFMTDWRTGRTGAVIMGLRHGVYCVGCCWLLMVVLFAVGVMNVFWGVVITAFVVAEKVVPWPRAVVWFGSAACLVGSAVLLAGRVV